MTTAAGFKMVNGLLGDVSDAHQALVERLKRLNAIERAAGVLRWDQEVMMPPGGLEARAGELSALATVAHERWTSDEMRQTLKRADEEANSRDKRAIVREAMWQHERRVRVPEALVERLSEVTSRAHSAWVDAKRASDFATFEPYLEEIVELRRRYADAIDPDRDPYEVLFEDHEPWLDWETAKRAIKDLRAGLVDLVDAAPEPPTEHALEGSWPLEAQRSMMEDVIEALGYDTEHGRLDESEHPFSTGNPYDARITTHLHEEDLLSGLTSTVHEFGHALYTQNLPREHLGTPLAKGRNLVVHEANSRLWENHVARSEAFWHFLAPHISNRFPDAGHLDPMACWAAANRVEPGPIRVDADELTYHLHIALRVEIEEKLIHGDLAVSEAPSLWNDRMESLLDVRPNNAAEGILQDVHWSHGSIGYFPTYSLGSMLAAQVYEALEADVGPRARDIEAGRFASIRDWLEEKIHRHGQRFTTDELIENVTGGELSADPFLSYADRKFKRVWSV